MSLCMRLKREKSHAFIIKNIFKEIQNMNDSPLVTVLSSCFCVVKQTCTFSTCSLGWQNNNWECIPAAGIQIQSAAGCQRFYILHQQVSISISRWGISVFVVLNTDADKVILYIVIVVKCVDLEHCALRLGNKH